MACIPVGLKMWPGPWIVWPTTYSMYKVNYHKSMAKWVSLNDAAVSQFLYSKMFNVYKNLIFACYSRIHCFKNL